MGQKLNNVKSLYLEGIRDGHYREAIQKYTGATYIQHSTGVKDGKEGFIEFFESFVARNPVRDIQIVRGWEDGDYVFVHAFQNINNGQAQWVTTDFFRTDRQNQILEHWDVIAPYMDSTLSGHTAMDGPTEVIDRDRTESNKILVREMLNNVLMVGAETTELERYFAPSFIQHNGSLPDGMESLKKRIESSDRTLTYQEIVLLVGQGNFVATLCRTHWNDAQHDQEYAQVDVFRCSEGRIVEHWDNVESVPAHSVNSGKF